jgi:hypothetical protein
MYPLDVIVTFLRLVYEHGRPFLTIPYKSDQPIELADYVKQFWGSRKKNKRTAQSLITERELLRELTNRFEGLQGSIVHTIIQELVAMSALCRVQVDVNGQEIEKFLLTPLGLVIWKRLDQGILFNQQQIDSHFLLNMLTRERLLEMVQMESAVWLGLHQSGLRAESAGPFTREMVCFGWYLLLNGAIAKEHALHLVRTSNKNYEWDETLVNGLNVIAQCFFDTKHLFKVPSIQDVLQRRSELTRGVGASFVWQKQQSETDEYSWWNIGDYTHDSSVLDHVMRRLVQRTLSLSNISGSQALEERVNILVAFFRHGVDNMLSRFQMSILFPLHNAPDFDYALQASFERALTEITATEDMSKHQS